MALRDTLDTPAVNDAFVLACLAEGLREDGRPLLGRRRLRAQFRRDEASAAVELSLGDTKVSCRVTAELTAPFPDRPSEGFLQFSVEFSALAAPGFEAGRPPPEAVEICRYVERSIRESGAIDLEALCILAGQQVWSLRCDVVVLDHEGNLRDGCSIAAMAALQHYRQPAVDVDHASKRVRVKHPDLEEPAPLPLHHIPWSVTFALMEAAGGEALLIYDPTFGEESVAQGTLTFSLNKHKEVCALHFPGGLALARETLAEAAEIAASKAVELHEAIGTGLSLADADYKTQQVRRLRQAAPEATTAGAPMEGLAQGAEQLEHLGYDDLHVTGTLRPDQPAKEKDDAGMQALMEALERAADLTEGTEEPGAANRRGDAEARAEAFLKGAEGSVVELRREVRPSAAGATSTKDGVIDSEDEDETMQLAAGT